MPENARRSTARGEDFPRFEPDSRGIVAFLRLCGSICRVHKPLEFEAARRNSGPAKDAGTPVLLALSGYSWRRYASIVAVFNEVCDASARSTIAVAYLGSGGAGSGCPDSPRWVAGADGKFAPATAKIEGATVVASSPDAAEPRFVRYGWANSPGCNLFNSAGLPASPFTAVGN